MSVDTLPLREGFIFVDRLTPRDLLFTPRLRRYSKLIRSHLNVSTQLH